MQRMKSMKKHERRLRKKLAKIQYRRNRAIFIELCIQMKKEIPSYVKRLLNLRKQAILLNRAKVSLGSWEPKPKDCHHNVTVWCQYNRKYKKVRGWLYFNTLKRFVAHSVVKAPDGKIYDITPYEVPNTYPFIPAHIEERKYVAIVHLSGGNLYHY